MSPVNIKMGMLLLLVAAANCVPVKDDRQNLSKQASLSDSRNLSKNGNGAISPLEEEEDENELIEVKEEDIPEGTLVLVVEEEVQHKVDKETMQTSSNVAFRPLFTYRLKQESSARRRISNNRARRRYYVPRRSYRQTYYPRRPYRQSENFRPPWI